jgi:hypothetical protein
MTIEKLKALLESGAITQEEYDELVKNINDPEPEPEGDPEPETDPKPEIDMEALERIIQSRVDKQLATERKKSAENERKYKQLQKQLMTADQLKEAEMAEKEAALAAREKELNDRLNREFAQKALREAGLDDGSENAFALADFVMADDEDEIKTRVKTFKELFTKAVAAEVDKRFKKEGYTPKKGTDLNGGKNPWSKDQWNITEQMNIEATNPELAAKLMAAAGAK